MTIRTRTITKALMIGTAVAWVAWDIVAAATPVAGDTESEIIAATARRHPLVPATFGVLMGHFFWHGRPVPGVVTAAALMCAAAAMAICSYVLRFPIDPLPAFVLGCVLGHFAWAQEAAR